MAVHPVTVNLSEHSYRRVQRLAKQTQRSVEQLLTDAVAALLPETTTLPSDLQTAVTQMALLNDAALWQMARTTLSAEQQQRLEALHDKQQRAQLSPAERAEEQALVRLYRETQLIRAQAVALLQQRGYDVSDPDQFAPLI
ncbi:MAG TPA: hypothetical protein GYA08_23620 [Chloroflexi bacterium]|nr:hypothetical protein [Chloroflexota bacterium]